MISQTGKGLQLVGILAIGGSLVLNSIYSKENADNINKANYKPKVVSAAIPAAGLLAFTIGIGISLDADKYIKFVN